MLNISMSWFYYTRHKFTYITHSKQGIHFCDVLDNNLFLVNLAHCPYPVCIYYTLYSSTIREIIDDLIQPWQPYSTINVTSKNPPSPIFGYFPTQHNFLRVRCTVSLDLINYRKF